MRTAFKKVFCSGHPAKVLLSFIAILTIQACDDVSHSETVYGRPRESKIARDMSEFEDGVRIAAANKRIDELERKVGTLESTPEKLDLDVLSRRVAALESETNAAAALATDVRSSKDNLGGFSSDSNAARSDSNARRVVKRQPPLNLPNLESGPRLATPAEAKAFAPSK